MSVQLNMQRSIEQMEARAAALRAEGKHAAAELMDRNIEHLKQYQEKKKV